MSRLTMLASLAEVELQLCLQSLDNRSRVMTARCSHMLLKAGSHPFAWRYAETVTESEPASAVLVTRLNSLTSLLRFTSLLYRAPPPDDSDLALTASLDHLTGLDLRALFHSSRVSELLLHDGVQSRLLKLALPPFSEHGIQNLEAAARLPHLTTLIAPLNSSNSDSFSFRTFASASTLTSLTLNFSFIPGVFAHGLDCFTALRSLTLKDAQWTDENLACIFTSAPALCATLQHLTLDFIWLNDHSNEPHAMPQTESAFGLLTALRTLELRQDAGVSVLLRAAARLPVLQWLRIHVADASDLGLQNSGLTADGMRTLMDAAYLLQLRLMCNADEFTSFRLGCSAHSRMAASTSQGFSVLQTIAQLPRVEVGEAAPAPDELLE